MVECSPVFSLFLVKLPPQDVLCTSWLSRQYHGMKDFFFINSSHTIAVKFGMHGTPGLGLVCPDGGEEWSGLRKMSPIPLLWRVPHSTSLERFHGMFSIHKQAV